MEILHGLATERSIFAKTRLWLWYFLACFFGLFSALALSLIVFSIQNNDWGIASYYSSNIYTFFWASFPYLLLVPFLIALIFAVIFVKISRAHQTFSWYAYFALTFFSIMLCAMLLFYSGFSALLHDGLSRFMIYDLVFKNRQEIWQSPASGLLAGEIGVITDQNDFFLRDFNNKIWEIKSSNPKISTYSIIRSTNKIKLIGRISDEKTFEAKEIWPY